MTRLETAASKAVKTLARVDDWMDAGQKVWFSATDEASTRAPKRMRKPLKLIDKSQEGLGQATIMNRDLAQQYGADYVKLAVFAIDVDRVCQEHSDNEALPLGWEIFVTEALLLSLIDGNDETQCALLEDMCLDLIIDQGDPRLGAQLPFAIFDAINRGALPAPLRALFHRWRSPSKSLLSDLAELWAERDVALSKLVTLCLETPLSPPLAPPTVQALQKLVAGG